MILTRDQRKQNRTCNVNRTLMTLPVLAAFLCLFTSTAYSWHMPEVSIMTPADGEDVTGPVVISATYSVSHGHVHTMRTLIDGQVADSKPAGSQSGTYTFTWNSASVTDGPHTIEVRAYTAAPPSDHFNKETITIHVSNALCRFDADCDDQDDHTQDTCANPGTPDAACVHAPIACLNDAECNDSDPLTLDSCQNAGTSESLCVNTAIQCNNNADCDDSNTHTEDVCLNGGTVSATCQHNPITCLNDAECNDSNPLTLDSCQNPGMASSTCVNQPIACNTNTDCSDSDAHTEDICQNGGTANAACQYNPIACLNDAECNDNDASTIDSCQNAGSASSLCVNTQTACLTNADCDDSNAYTQDTCNEGGTVNAACDHAPIACLTNTDCNDSDPLTLDECQNPGTTASSCSNTAILCNTNSDCDDSDSLTQDVCVNGGTNASSCAHDPLACNSSADCDDSNAYTLDQCENPGTTSSVCTHAAIACLTNEDCNDGNDHTLDACHSNGTQNASCSHDAIACLNNGDCDDDNPLTLDSCSNPGTAGASCAHISVSCLADTDCNDSNALTLDSCQNPGASNASCVNSSIACNTNTDCDDNNAYTIDNCSNGGGANASCSHVSIVCLADSDCDDGKSNTTDTCINPGSASAVCQHTPKHGGDDDDPPGSFSLVVTSPQENLLTNLPSLTVTGTTHPQAVATVNDAPAPVSASGDFSLVIALSEGRNKIKIKACRSQGCRTEVRFVTLDTAAPHLFSVKPPDGTVFPCKLKPISMEIHLRDDKNGSGIDPASITLSANGDDVAFRFSQGSGKITASVPVDQCAQTIVVLINASDKAGNPLPSSIVNYVIEEDPNGGGGSSNYNGWIVYSSLINGNSLLHLNINGSVTALTTGERYAGNPAFVEGTLAYTLEDRSGNTRIRIAELRQTQSGINVIEKQTVSASNDYNAQPSLSQDRKRMVFISKSKKSGTALYFDDLSDNKQPVRIEGTDGALMPSLSPDASRAVFVSDADGAHSLYLVSFGKKTRPERLTDPARGIDSDPVFSPDGQHIYFSSNRDGQFDIYRMDADGNNLQRITDTPEREVRLAFTPDARLVCSILSDGKYAVYEVDADTGQTAALIQSQGDNLPR